MFDCNFPNILKKFSLQICEPRFKIGGKIKSYGQKTDSVGFSYLGDFLSTCNFLLCIPVEHLCQR
jgi:hypothetical protein